MAAGKWVLHRSYLEACRAAGCFIQACNLIEKLGCCTSFHVCVFWIFFCTLLGKDLTSERQIAIWGAQALEFLEDPKSEKCLASFSLKTSCRQKLVLV